MKSISKAVLVVLAGLALSAAATTAAQAAEGPFYKVTGARLKSGESKETIIRTNGTIAFVSPETGIRYTCERFSTGKAKILGSTGANSSSSEEQFEISQCVVTGNGPECKGPFPLLSAPLQAKLVYLNSERTGVLGIQFLPVSGKKVLTLNFTGSSCRVTSISFFGSFTGELLSGKKPVEVGKEPAEATTLEVSFPATPIKTTWSEVSGALAEATSALESGGGEAKVEGGFTFELVSGSKWGVYTK